MILVFSIPSVQTKAAHQLTSYLNENFDTDIHIQKVKITYDAQIDLKGVYIGDHHNDTLITAQSLQTSLINIPGILSGENIDFGSVTAKHVVFHLRRYKADEIDSFGIFLHKLSGNKSDGDGARVKFSHLTIVDGTFSFVDEHNKYPRIINLHHLNIEASDFVIDQSDIFIKVEKMSGVERRGLKIKDLHFYFALIEDHMNFDNFSLETANSSIQAQVHFSFDSTMTDFENRVHIMADFEKASVSTTDLNYYFDKFGTGHQLRFHGILKGTLNDYELQDFYLNGMNHTAIHGNMAFKNMLGEKEFRFDGNFKRFQSNYDDLVNLMPELLQPVLPEVLKELGHLGLSGRVSVTKRMVNTHSWVKTDLGSAKLNFKLSNLKSPGYENYEGRVKFKDFQLGKLLENPKFGKANFIFNMNGKGFETEDLNSHLEGTFTSLEFNGYTYHDITITGALVNPIFTGEIISRDPNLKMHFNGRASLSTKENNYDFKAHVDYADLRALNFVKNDSVAIFKGEVSLDMKGHDIDDLEGKLELENAVYKNGKGSYEFKKLSLVSTFTDDVRRIAINSPDIINGEVKGHFVLSEIPDLVKNAVGKLYSNYQPIAIEKNQYLTFKISIHNKIIQALFPKISIKPETFIKGEVNSTYSGVELVFRSPEITYEDAKVKGIKIHLDSSNPLFTTFVDIDSVSTDFYDLSEFFLISKRLRDTLFVRTQLMGGAHNDDEFNLNFYHTINEDNHSVVGIRRSNLKFKGLTWLLNKNREDQSITFSEGLKNITLDTLVMSYQDEDITLTGVKRGKSHMDFQLGFNNVDLEKVMPSIEDFHLEGLIDGELEVVQEKGVYYPSSDLTIKNFAINEEGYGDLNLNIQGNNSLTSYQVNAKLSDGLTDYLTAKGHISVGDHPVIDVAVDLHQFEIGVLNSLADGVIDHVHGKASGHAHVGGDYRKPTIVGELTLDDAGFEIPYLNVDLAFEDQAIVQLQGQQFYFDHVNFEDTKYHTKGRIDGVISHNNFRDWRMNLNLTAPERLLVLDTKFSEESLYYGTAFISGTANISGPFDELVINVDATSEKGTVFKIPLSDAESIGGNAFVYFLTPEDKKARQKGEEIAIKELKGLELNFDLDVTHDAMVEIIVDRESGSKLRGRGAGTLLIEINTNGKFNMWGDFVVYQGIYDFRYAGLINKIFTVVPGGSVTWDGSPLRANLNVRALYKTHANPASILESTTINRSIPVNVYIDLNGLLNDVDIQFELEYPNLSSMVKSELHYRITSRENTELQALSLITQGSFYSPYTPGGNAHPENLLFERAANLFDNLISGAGNKFKVGVDYTKGNRLLEQDIADRVGVTLSTRISDRILINGRVGVPIGGYTRSVVVGDIQIEFLLNEEGTLRAKIFNRESDIQYIGEKLGYTQGVGIAYSVDFDTFKELIHKILNKDIKEVADIPKKIKKDDKATIIPDYIHFP